METCEREIESRLSLVTHSHTWATLFLLQKEQKSQWDEAGGQARDARVLSKTGS